MEFKIDTKDTFSIIDPASAVLNANMAQSLAEKCLQNGQNGSNFIVDLHNVQQIDVAALQLMADLHEKMYSNNQSLVFTELQPEVWVVVREQGADELLNIAPKMIEAIDIISMEILERDLLGEE